MGTAHLWPRACDSEDCVWYVSDIYGDLSIVGQMPTFQTTVESDKSAGLKVERTQESSWPSNPIALAGIDSKSLTSCTSQQPMCMRIHNSDCTPCSVAQFIDHIDIYGILKDYISDYTATDCDLLLTLHSAKVSHIHYHTQNIHPSELSMVSFRFKYRTCYLHIECAVLA